MSSIKCNNNKFMHTDRKENVFKQSDMFYNYKSYNSVKNDLT